jgi:serine/threonine-protein kinase
MRMRGSASEQTLTVASVKGDVVQLAEEWIVGEQLGSGGFGAVYEASANGTRAAIKFVRKAPGAQRELLFVDLVDVANVVPVIDSGETDTHWVLVMPLADYSLRERMDSREMKMDDILVVLRDIAESLTDLDRNGVVHRDLKPENVLRLGGRWCLADFGISRYAEATTAPDTVKYAMSYPYAAPERWRGERASSATDVYALGVIAYELFQGERPFRGPTEADYRDQHLHQQPPPLGAGGTAIGAAVEECLYKAAGARPSPTNLVQRLAKIAERPPSSGLAKLQEANRAEVLHRAAEALADSEAKSESERRSDLVGAAKQALVAISETLRQQVLEHASAATPGPGKSGGWVLSFHSADLQFTTSRPAPADGVSAQGGTAPIDVIAYAAIKVTMRTTNSYNYLGRQHSLWYCDVQEAGRYLWYETAFMQSALSRSNPQIHPFAMDPGPPAGEAMSTTIGTAQQLAWPFTPLVPGELDDFIARWAEWFASAAGGSLQHPSHMPEKPPRGSYRT